MRLNTVEPYSVFSDKDKWWTIPRCFHLVGRNCLHSMIARLPKHKSKVGIPTKDLCRPSGWLCTMQEGMVVGCSTEWMLQQGLLCLSAPTEVLYVRGCSQMMASPEGKRGETNAHFRSSIIKPSLEICLIINTKRKKSYTQGGWTGGPRLRRDSGAQPSTFCCQISYVDYKLAHGGVTVSHKNDDVIYEHRCLHFKLGFVDVLMIDDMYMI